jgi:hypothetical protein
VGKREIFSVFLTAKITLEFYKKSDPKNFQKPAPRENPTMMTPPVVIFRRISVRAEIGTQNPVLSNTWLAKMVPLSHLCRQLQPFDVDCFELLQHRYSEEVDK